MQQAEKGFSLYSGNAIAVPFCALLLKARTGPAAGKHLPQGTNEILKFVSHLSCLCQRRFNHVNLHSVAIDRAGGRGALTGIFVDRGGVSL
jgi:hypothetical protein